MSKVYGNQRIHILAKSVLNNIKNCSLKFNIKSVDCFWIRNVFETLPTRMHSGSEYVPFSLPEPDHKIVSTFAGILEA